MRAKGIVVDADTPPAMAAMAKKRVEGLIDHYGNNLRHLPIESLAVSCYLQGIRDAIHVECRCSGKVSQSGVTLQVTYPSNQ